MIYQPEYVKALLKKYTEGTASPVEVARLMAAWDIYDDEELSEMIAEVTFDFKDTDIDRTKWRHPTEKSLNHSVNISPVKKKYSAFTRQIKRVAVFIPVLAFVCFLMWLLSRPQALKYSCNGVSGSTELPTGRYTCKLTLSNNCNILIDSTYKGVITEQGNVEIIQPSPGILEYKPKSKVSVEETVIYNSIETSKGQQYQIVLPDGTGVRLNAASSIRFPVGFTNENRTVHLSGEALFDVIKNDQYPFYVITKNSRIKVLGTTFNVNAYSTNTVATLLTGSLEITSTSETARLTPGEKAIVWSNSQANRDTIVVGKGDTLQAVSWKNTMRIYSKVFMRDFVADMGRWYGLEITNLGCVPANGVISVSICYDAPVDDVLRIFERTGLKFLKTGNKITFCKPTHQ